MRISQGKLPRLLALCAAALLACGAAAGAAWGASTGGSAAPAPASTSSHGKPKIHSTGLATWFGPGFYGNETACGQTLTPAVVGVANRTLPCGTLVRVTYHGRTLTVPVLDRGPYSHIGADWDLTAGAAEALGIDETVRIGTRLAGRTPNTPDLGLPPAANTLAATGGAAAG
jgi:rare lipoprotein A (peptidoglycan hydrolase)